MWVAWAGFQFMHDVGKVVFRDGLGCTLPSGNRSVIDRLTVGRFVSTIATPLEHRSILRREVSTIASPQDA